MANITKKTRHLSRTSIFTSIFRRIPNINLSIKLISININVYNGSDFSSRSYEDINDSQVVNDNKDSDIEI